MINQKDIRIGNQLWYNGRTYDRLPVTVLGISSQIIEVTKACCDITKLEPIPLTEQSILKLDFTKDNSENNKTYLSPMFDGNVIKIYFNRFGVAKFQINMHFQIELPYIHTLQNLYHTLSSGRELVFNE